MTDLSFPIRSDIENLCKTINLNPEPDTIILKIISKMLMK